MPFNDKELLFNELLQPHWDIFARETSTLIQQLNVYPKVFISYAWPSQKYPDYDAERDIQAWLLVLYQRLTGLGVSVFFDIKTMTLGANIDQFMRQGIDNCDVVLIIGTKTYKTRSEENTNVKKEVDHIKTKIHQKGTGCVIPILYRGDFAVSLPDLGQILGTNCSDELFYQENLPLLIEGLFGLSNNSVYQTSKEKYVARIKDIKTHGLSDNAIQIFTAQRAQKMREALRMQQEAVNLMLEKNFKGHPDYVARPVGAESPSIKMLASLKEKYQRYTHVQALFGKPMALEGQYINVQMLYQVLEEKKPENKNETYKTSDENKDKSNNKEFKDARITSFETIFSKKEPIAIQ